MILKSTDTNLSVEHRHLADVQSTKYEKNKHIFNFYANIKNTQLVLMVPFRHFIVVKQQ